MCFSSVHLLTLTEDRDSEEGEGAEGQQVVQSIEIMIHVKAGKLLLFTSDIFIVC